MISIFWNHDIRALVLWQPWWLLTANICWALTVHQILSILHVSSSLVLNTNLEVGTGYCWSLLKPRFNLQMSCVRLRGEYVGEPGLKPYVCLTSQAVLLSTVPRCSFAIWINLGSPEPLITTLSLRHAAFCCFPAACFKTHRVHNLWSGCIHTVSTHSSSALCGLVFGMGYTEMTSMWSRRC